MRNYHGEAKVKLIAESGKASSNACEITLMVTQVSNTKWTYEYIDVKSNKILIKDNHNQAPDKLIDTQTSFFSKIIKAELGETAVNDDNKARNINAMLEGYSLAKQDAEKKLSISQQKAEERKEKLMSSYLEKGEKVFHDFKLKGINVPRYITSVSRWLIANEEANIVKVLLAILNTARGEATNIIQESASASGKTAIEMASFNLVHPHHYITLNYVTPASFKNLCIDNRHVFKNKVIRLGDLGTEANQEVIQEIMGIIKILNSEGRYESSKMHKNGEDHIHIVLEGRSAMCYSKVSNGVDISDQDSSRGIVIAPNPNNDEEFKRFIAWQSIPDVEDKRTTMVKRYTEDIRNYIEYLISQDIEIVNPYMTQISDILQKNKVYRRKLSKELWLINSLALLNLPNKKIYEINGHKLIYVSVEDIVNYMTIYRSSLMASSNFDVSTHGYALYEMLAKEYEPIPDYRARSDFRDELGYFNTDTYEESLFEQSKKFFTIKSINEKYIGNPTYTSLISEIQEGTIQDKIRSVLQGMPDKIGRYNMTENEFNKPYGKPTMYYIMDIEKSNIFNSVSIDFDYISMMYDAGLGQMVEDIMDDFENTPYQTETLIDEEKAIIVFDENENNILEHYECVEIPPTIHIPQEQIEKAKSVWDKRFGKLIEANKNKKLYNKVEVDE